MDEGQAILLDLAGKYPQITLIVDALDECERKTRIRFVNVLDNLVLKSPMPVKIFISSRPDRDIKDRFAGGPNVEIRATDNRGDIEKFVDYEIHNSPQYWRDQVGLGLMQTICGILVEKSQGMWVLLFNHLILQVNTIATKTEQCRFQWVSLQINQLLELSRPSDIRDRLGKLPESLKDAYDEIYDKIRAQKGSAPAMADRAFQWVMCSRDPLSPATLTAAVCQDPRTDVTDDIDIDFSFVLEACRNLLVIDQELDICRFSHLSVQEYFEDHHWKQDETNGLVGKVCLSLLNDPQQNTSLPDLENDMNGLLRYARFHWMTHVVQHEHGGYHVDSRMAILLKRFLGSMNESGLAYRKWYESIKELVEIGFRELPLPLSELFPI